MQIVINRSERNKKLIIGYGSKDDEVLLYFQEQLSMRGLKFILLIDDDRQFDDETKNLIDTYKRTFKGSTSWGIINDKQ